MLNIMVNPMLGIKIKAKNATKTGDKTKDDFNLQKANTEDRKLISMVKNC